MRVFITRVHKAQVFVKVEAVSSIDKGIVIFVGIEKGDEHYVLAEMAEKIVNLRIFEDEDGKLNHSVKNKNYRILCISNFTLCADTDKGRRPSFENSMSYQAANKLFENFILVLKSKGIGVEAGVFGGHMDIKLEMDGPVNIIL